MGDERTNDPTRAGYVGNQRPDRSDRTDAVEAPRSDPELDALAVEAGVDPGDDSAAEEDQLSEARLVEQVRQGDNQAYGVLVRRYERRVLRVIRRFISDRDTAEDLAQDAFLKAFERLHQFDASRRFGPWLFRIAVNGTLDHLRRRKRRGWLGFFGARETAFDPGSPDPRPAQETAAAVRFAIEQLPEKYRTVLVLRDLENFSTSEIAAVLGRKEATIRWRLAEARTRFRDVWVRQQQVDETNPDFQSASDGETTRKSSRSAQRVASSSSGSPAGQTVGRFSRDSKEHPPS